MYFNDDRDDPYNAREHHQRRTRPTSPTWANGVSIGNIIAGYHRDFLAALEASWVDEVPVPEPEPEPEAELVSIAINTTGNAKVTIVLNGVIVETAS